MSLNTAYRDLVAEMDSPHVRKTPTTTFTTVLMALATANDEQQSYPRAIATRTGIDPSGVSRALRRMVRLELADRWLEPGTPWELRRPPRTYYKLTAAGQRLAAEAGAS